MPVHASRKLLFHLSSQVKNVHSVVAEFHTKPPQVYLLDNERGYSKT